MSVVIGGNIKGATIISGGGRVIIDGKVYQGEPGSVTVIQGEPLPEVHEEWDGITSVQIDGDSVSLGLGDRFTAHGQGFCERRGNAAFLSNYTGTVALPRVETLTIKTTSGDVHGIADADNLSLKANSGDIRLTLRADKPLPNIAAKTNSGNITISLA